MNIKEQLTALLPGVEISDEFVNKLTASIETAVAQRVEEQTEEIKEQARAYGEYALNEVSEVAEKANAYAEYVVEEMTKKVEDYCEYVIEQFVEENRAKLVETEEYCRMAKALRAVREAFEVNYFQVNNTEPAAIAIANNLEESRKEFNVLFEQHRTLKRQVEDYSKYVEGENRKAVFESVTRDLADTQKERLSRLVERAEFPSLDSYREGLKLMVEEIKPTGMITETAPAAKEPKGSSEADPAATFPDKMKAYLERL